MALPSLVEQKLNLANWIDRELKKRRVIEHTTVVIQEPSRKGKYHCCAGGIAMVGKCGNPERAREAFIKARDRAEMTPRTSDVEHVRAMSMVLGVRYDLMNRVDMLHCSNNCKAKNIAEMLRAEAKAEMKKRQAK